MKKYKAIYQLFLAISLVISHALVAFISISYTNMIYWTEYEGFSGNAIKITVLASLPFVLALIATIILTTIFYKKSKKA